MKPSRGRPPPLVAQRRAHALELLVVCTGVLSERLTPDHLEGVDTYLQGLELVTVGVEAQEDLLEPGDYLVHFVAFVDAGASHDQSRTRP